MSRWTSATAFLGRAFRREPALSPEAPAAPLGPALEELLLSTTGAQIDERMARTWAPVIGSLDSGLARLQRAGLLRPATPAEQLNSALRIADLKRILAAHGLPISGRKAEIIERLLDAVGDDEAERLAGGLRLYSATAEGARAITQIRERKEQARAALESEAAADLRAGDVRRAADRIARHEAGRVFPRGLGLDWSLGMPGPSIARVARLIGYPYDDLPVSLDQRREVGVQLALSELLGEGMYPARARLLLACGGTFRCGPLEAFLRARPCGDYAASHDPDDPGDLAELYAHTQLFKASAETDLERLRAGRIGKGVKVGDSADTCRVCRRGKHHFAWSVVDQVPTLPRHWGCRCLYEAWLEDRQFAH